MFEDKEDEAAEPDGRLDRLRRDLSRGRGLDAGRNALSSALDPPRDDLEDTRALLREALSEACQGSPALNASLEILDRIVLEESGALEAIKALRTRLEEGGLRALALRFSLFEARLFRRSCSDFLDQLEEPDA